MAMFINYHPAYGSWVAKIVVLEFKGVEGLPIQINSPAFEDGFRKARIFWMPWGTQGYAIRLVMEYDPSINYETASAYASTISEEVMKIINQTKLPTFFRKTFLDNATNIVIAIVDHGFLPEALSSIEGLLEYRPRGGFADLITESFLQNYVPGKIDSTGRLGQSLTELEYSLQKINNSYRWDFKISISLHTELKDEEWDETLDLNSLLFNDRPIEPSEQRTSEIIVEMPKYHKIPTGTYEMSIEDISPSQSVEEDDWMRVTYQLTAPIDNVVATVKVSKLRPSFEWDKIIAIVLVIVALAVIAILFLKKRKGGEKGK